MTLPRGDWWRHHCRLPGMTDSTAAGRDWCHNWWYTTDGTTDDTRLTAPLMTHDWRHHWWHTTDATTTGTHLHLACLACQLHFLTPPSQGSYERGVAGTVHFSRGRVPEHDTLQIQAESKQLSFESNWHCASPVPIPEFARCRTHHKGLCSLSSAWPIIKVCVVSVPSELVQGAEIDSWV